MPLDLAHADRPAPCWLLVDAVFWLVRSLGGAGAVRQSCGHGRARCLLCETAQCPPKWSNAAPALGSHRLTGRAWTVTAHPGWLSELLTCGATSRPTAGARGSPSAQRLAEDAARRDFMIDALDADPETLAIADAPAGLHDLAVRRVRFIGDTRAWIAEDHLRHPAPSPFSGAVRRGALTRPGRGSRAWNWRTRRRLSRERIAAEPLASRATAGPHATVERMRKQGRARRDPAEAGRDLAVLLGPSKQKQHKASPQIQCGGSPRYSRPHPMLPRLWRRGCDCRKPSAIGWSARRSVPRLMPTIRTRSPTASPRRSRSTACYCWGTTPVASPIGPCPSSP